MYGRTYSNEMWNGLFRYTHVGSISSADNKYLAKKASYQTMSKSDEHEIIKASFVGFVFYKMCSFDLE